MSGDFRSLEIRFMVRELSEKLLGGRLRKVYQYGSGEKSFLFDVYVQGRGGFWLYADAERMFITNHKKESPETPPNFCMLLRKHLTGATIKDIRQRGFDRIVEIATENCVLVFEFVPPGNLILCDNFYNIIMPMQSQRWKDREVLPRAQYRPPPSGANPYSITLEAFSSVATAAGEEKAGAFIAKMGFGPAYSDEICVISGIDAAKPCGKLTEEETSRIFTAMRQLGEAEAQPVTYGDGSIFPVPLTSRKDPVSVSWQSFSAPLDEAFARQATEGAAKDKDDKIGKLQRIVGRQKEASEKLLTKRAQSREKGDAIYRHFSLADEIIRGVAGARDRGLSWEEIKKSIAAGQAPWAHAVKDVREHEGIVITDLGGMEVALDFTKSAEQNAASCYEKSKDARRKYEGAQAAITEKTAQIEGAAAQDAAAPQKPVLKERVKKPKAKWYERFRWFISSKRFLIVAGKDAASNEDLIKKRTEAGDMVFHTDVQGSAFVVVKARAEKGTKFSGVAQGGAIPPEVKKEASEIAAACSKAWSQGFGSIDVYAVKPDQVSKTPPSGTSLPKGSFMIYGQREWFRDVEVKMAIGVLVDRPSRMAEAIAGPVMAMRAYAKYFVTVKAGETPATELAKQVRDRLGYKATPEYRELIEKIPLESIERLIPSGTGTLVV